MVAVDQGGVHGGQVGQDVQAQVLVEDVAAPEPALVLRRVEVGHRIDDVQLAVGPEAIEHEHGVLAPQRTDLDHALGLDGVENGRDDELPKRKHDWLATPEVGWKREE